MISKPETYYTVVFVHKQTDKVISTGTVIIEHKFTRGGSKVGHIEDIAVDKSFGGRGLGLKLIKGLEEISRSLGTYKTILDCAKENIGFYEKCGFTQKEYEMVKYATTSDAHLAPGDGHSIQRLSASPGLVPSSSPSLPEVTVTSNL